MRDQSQMRHTARITLSFRVLHLPNDLPEGIRCVFIYGSVCAGCFLQAGVHWSGWDSSIS